MSVSIETLTGARPSIVGPPNGRQLGLEALVHRQMHVAVLLDKPGEQQQRTLNALDYQSCL